MLTLNPDNPTVFDGIHAEQETILLPLLTVTVSVRSLPALDGLKLGMVLAPTVTSVAYADDANTKMSARIPRSLFILFIK